MKIIKHFDIILIVILVLNALFLGYLSFFKKDVINLEIMKAGGRENFKLVKQLYENPSYISQQREGIQQGLDSLGIK